MTIKVEKGNTKYDSRDDCNAIIDTESNTLIVGCKNTIIPNDITKIGHSAFYNCSGLTSLTIPSSVISIEGYDFSGCSGLTTIRVEKGNTKYDSRDDCNAIIETESNTLIVGCKNTIIPSSVLSIGGSAFRGRNNMASITIPNSVTSIGSSAFWNCSGLSSVTVSSSVTEIGWGAFYGCSGLSSVTFSNSVTSIGGSAFSGCSGLTSVAIPNSVKSIGSSAFSDCSGLISVQSGITNLFDISDDVFDSSEDIDLYATAILTVPAGLKSVYQSTAGWNKFQNIVEEGADESIFEENGITYSGKTSTKTATVQAISKELINVLIPESVTHNGKSYNVTAIVDNVFADIDVHYMSLPSSVTSVTDKTFSRCNMGALIWDVEAVLPNNAFSNASIGSNFLLYVKSSSYAPSSVKNVVVNGTAQTIVLSDDGGQFYCPQAFTARSISYTHNYSMETDIGKAKGWETLALPFDVQKILHSTRGEIVPFPSYNSSSTQKPFWLANFSGSGFRRTAAVLANEPYIIAMPNSSSYRNEYNLAGDVTFSADNVQVPKTPTFSGTFVPAFATVAKSSSVYALNVNNRNVKYSGSYDAGSRFIANLRDVRSFEAYISNSSTRGIIEISFDDGTTDMLDILLPTDECQEVTIHTLSGQQITRTTQRDFDAVWQQLPKGVYIINGKKWIK